MPHGRFCFACDAAKRNGEAKTPAIAVSDSGSVTSTVAAADPE
jgi:hypothetical protein